MVCLIHSAHLGSTAFFTNNMLVLILDRFHVKKKGLMDGFIGFSHFKPASFKPETVNVSIQGAG